MRSCGTILAAGMSSLLCACSPAPSDGAGTRPLVVHFQMRPDPLAD